MPLLSERRTYFSVEYDQREEIKRMGGKWDKDMKKWFAEAGMDLIPFIRAWNLSEPTKNLKISESTNVDSVGDSKDSRDTVRQCIYPKDLYALWNHPHSTQC